MNHYIILASVDLSYVGYLNYPGWLQMYFKTQLWFLVFCTMEIQKVETNKLQMVLPQT